MSSEKPDSAPETNNDSESNLSKREGTEGNEGPLSELQKSEVTRLTPVTSGSKGRRLLRSAILLSSIAAAVGGGYEINKKIEADSVKVASDRRITKSEIEKWKKQVEDKGREKFEDLDGEDFTLYILRHPEKFAKKSWGADAIKTAALRGYEDSLDMDWLKYVSESDGKAILEQIMAKGGKSAATLISSYRFYKNHPYADQLLEKAVHLADSEKLIEDARIYRHLPDAPEIFKKAAAEHSRSRLLIENFERYKDYPGAEEILKNALANRSNASMLLKQAETFIDLPWTHKYIKEAAEADPYALVEYRWAIKKLPEQKELVEKAIQKIFAGGGEEDYLFRNFDSYKDIPNAEEIFKNSAERLATAGRYSAREMILRYGAAYLREYPWMGEDILQAIRLTPEYVIESLDPLLAIPVAGIQDACLDALKKVADPKKLITHQLASTPLSAGLVREAINKEPVEALKNSYVFSAYKDGDQFMEQMFRKAAAESPRALIAEISSSAATKKYAVEAIKSASSQYPADFLWNAGSFRDKTYRDQIREAVKKTFAQGDFRTIIGYAAREIPDDSEVVPKVVEAIKADPKAAYESFHWEYWFQNSKSRLGIDTIEPGLKKYVVDSLIQSDPKYLLAEGQHRIETDADPDLIRKLLASAANHCPNELVDRFRTEWLHTSGVDKSIEAAFVNDPFAFGRALSTVVNPKEARGKDIDVFEGLYDLLEKSGDQRVQRALQVNRRVFDERSREVKGPERPYDYPARMVLITIVHPEIDFESAKKIAGSDPDFFKLIIRDKASGKKEAGEGVREALKRISLHEVYAINELHERPDAVRFKSAEAMTPQEMYVMMGYAEQEIFTSTFNGLFDRMMRKMKAENMGGDALLKECGYENFRVFLKMASNFNRLQEFLNSMSEAQSKELLSNFIKLREDGDFLNQAVTIADTFSSIQDPAISKFLGEEIKKEYLATQGSKNAKAKVVYGLLTGMFAEKHVTDDEWVKKIGEKYKLPNLLELKQEDLFNPDGSDIQEYFFYNDQDGKSSFQSFLSEYRGRPEWRIEDSQEYVRIVSNTAGPKHIEIFANKPEYESVGNDRIEEIFKNRKVNSIVVVHRGHSYHVESTIRRITPIARVVSLGSCGGYHNLAAVLERSPEAHIISTKGTGTMAINDPILLALNEKIRHGENIRWSAFWAEMESKLGKNPNFVNYVPPHKNLGVMFLKAYNRNLEHEQSSQY